MITDAQIAIMGADPANADLPFAAPDQPHKPWHSPVMLLAGTDGEGKPWLWLAARCGWFVGYDSQHSPWVLARYADMHVEQCGICKKDAPPADPAPSFLLDPDGFHEVNCPDCGCDCEVIRVSDSTTAPDAAAAYLSEVEQREQAATPGPWWSDESDQCWRLHGVHAIIPATLGAETFDQVLNRQILKAPKTGTPYAEYWPGEADDAFITHARSDVPRLLRAVRAGLDLAQGWKAEAQRLDAMAERSGDSLRRQVLSVRAQGCDDHGSALLGAMSAALTGEDGT